MPALSIIGRIYDEFSCHCTIPSSYRPTLEQRLLTFGKAFDRQPRFQTRRPKREYMSHYREKKAQQVYLDVLENYTHILLPFLIAVSPRACSNIDLVRVAQYLNEKPRLQLNRNFHTILEDTARRVDVLESTNFKRLVELLFPPDDEPVPRPTTGAESDDSWTYYASDLNAISEIFGKRIYSVVNNSENRLIEEARGSTISTESVRSKFPRNNTEDAIILLNIGFDHDLMLALFPTAYKGLFPLNFESALDSARTVLEHQETAGPAPETLDSAYYTFTGALVSSINSFFGPQICRAIQESQLRKWEITTALIKSTDCVSVDICRKRPHHGILSLRIGFGLGIGIANALHALPHNL